MRRNAKLRLFATVFTLPLCVLLVGCGGKKKSSTEKASELALACASPNFTVNQMVFTDAANKNVVDIKFDDRGAVLTRQSAGKTCDWTISVQDANDLNALMQKISYCGTDDQATKSINLQNAGKTVSFSMPKVSAETTKVEGGYDALISGLNSLMDDIENNGNCTGGGGIPPVF